MEKYSVIEAYAVKHKDELIRAESRSGGVFTAISDWVFEKNGVVYGCALNEKFLAVHKRAENKEERNKFRGSKYIQSDLGRIFCDIEKDLLEGKYVLFSGTACQIEGLRKYLLIKKTDITKLILLDILCHGVPSPMVWSDYLDWVQNKHQGNIESVNFRNKEKYGWKDHVETININGKEYDSRIFTTLFYSHYILRPSCFKCKFKSLNRNSDITIADCWGIEEEAPKFNDDKGVSLVLINTSVGELIFNEIQDKLDILKCNIDNYMQKPLKGNFVEPVLRKEFWKDYENHDFDKIVKKYVVQKDKVYMRIKIKFKKEIRKLLKQ